VAVIFLHSDQLRTCYAVKYVYAILDHRALHEEEDSLLIKQPPAKERMLKVSVGRLSKGKSA